MIFPSIGLQCKHVMSSCSTITNTLDELGTQCLHQAQLIQFGTCYPGVTCHCSLTHHSSRVGRHLPADPSRCYEDIDDLSNSDQYPCHPLPDTFYNTADYRADVPTPRTPTECHQWRHHNPGAVSNTRSAPFLTAFHFPRVHTYPCTEGTGLLPPSIQRPL